MIESLVHYPTTLAPVNGSMAVTTKCADNAQLKPGSNLNVTCVSNGSWSGLIPQCECDDEYRPIMVDDKIICKGFKIIITVISTLDHDILYIYSKYM